MGNSSKSRALKANSTGSRAPPVKAKVKDTLEAKMNLLTETMPELQVELASLVAADV